MKMKIFLLLVCTYVNAWAIETYGSISTNGSRITFITSTSTIPCHPSTSLIEKTQASFFSLPDFASIPKIIVFDYPRETYFCHRTKQTLPIRAVVEESYAQYKKKMIELVNTSPIFTNTLLVFLDTYQNLSGGIREALQFVETKYIFIHQHDFLLIRNFDLDGILDSMELNKKIQYVRINLSPNVVHGNSETFIDEYVEGGSLVPLCRTHNWSDHEHIATKRYYTNFVLPAVGNRPIPMEHELAHPIRNFLDRHPEKHSKYGIYIYGKKGEAPYVKHLDGNRWKD